jgi:hypothetical protein
LQNKTIPSMTGARADMKPSAPLNARPSWGRIFDVEKRRISGRGRAVGQ